MPLVQFSPLKADIWTLDDAFQGTVIFGENGSGKTTGSGQLLAGKFLRAGFGGLVLCAEIEEADLWREIPASCRARKGRLVLLGRFPVSLQLLGLRELKERERFSRKSREPAL